MGTSIVAIKTQERIDECSSITEIAIMSTLKHKNIQNIKGFSFQNNETLIHMTVQKGSLYDMIYFDHKYVQGLDKSKEIWNGKSKNQFSLINLPLRRNFAKQILVGLAYIHDNGIIHADIKPQNILVTKSNIIKIADFGISILNVPGVNDYSFRNPLVVTLPYRDINILYATINNSLVRYSFEIDIWATAVMLMEMETGSNPFGRGNSEEGVIKLIQQLLGKYNERMKRETLLNIIIEEDLRYLLLKMLQYDNFLRITAKQALTELKI